MATGRRATGGAIQNTIMRWSEAERNGSAPSNDRCDRSRAVRPELFIEGAHAFAVEATLLALRLPASSDCISRMVASSPQSFANRAPWHSGKVTTDESAAGNS
jgi:hypothetical protein